MRQSREFWKYLGETRECKYQGRVFFIGGKLRPTWMKSDAEILVVFQIFGVDRPKRRNFVKSKPSSGINLKRKRGRKALAVDSSCRNKIWIVESGENSPKAPLSEISDSFCFLLFVCEIVTEN